MPTNARFWTLRHGSPVQLTIRPGESLTTHRYTPTDEGYDSETCTYEHTGDDVVCFWSTDGRDCDGRLSSEGVSICAITDLHAGYAEPELGITWPKWRDGGSSQRDYAAEAMGY
jgi:hypothetical protein